MSVINELIRTEANGSLSFGNYELEKKTKVSDYENKGDLYKVKTFLKLPDWKRTECLSMNPFREPQ